MEHSSLVEKNMMGHFPRSSLDRELKNISEKCINCECCQKECAFLNRYGKPKEIADTYNPFDKTCKSIAFECNLCELCAEVCPVHLNPTDMFLEMRREAMQIGNGNHREYSRILGYEKRGTSKRYTYYALPLGCDTIFFPGCTLAGTRPDKTIKLYEYMRKKIPTLGITLDCCTKPSHDLGREDYFNAMFQEMKDFLVKNGIKNVLVACPNCYKVFSKHGGELSVKTVYEFLTENVLPETEQVSGTATIHDPCPLRHERSIHLAVRDLAIKKGLTIEEMPHHGEKTICCGEGGSVGCVSTELAKNWGNLRKYESDGRRIITYCAGCSNLLGELTPTSHILDLLFEPEATLTGKVKVSNPPLTYLNRLRLKKYLKNTINCSVTRERKFTANQKKKEKRSMKRRVSFIVFFIIAILTIRFTGLTRFLEQETLRQLIQSYGVLAPVIYMLIYTVAPAFFLPGLPITIAGGILFGPFWGVVYTITSATMGACVAFLISRYIAREWIEAKLKSPRWQRLDDAVKRNGWKVVAFTRLIPLFPFNLLNYAFGLTKIKFFHYAIASFFCMLPSCIAYVVFSSSLLDLIKGKISPMFVVGIGLIISVSLIPLFFRRYKARKGANDIL
ncbi:MAG: VTT domain-containing protein [Thermodesulfobacteriota bacterium]|nr:VTT domain-containing protein [Thermodesulfobacteriota bacterium]